MKSSGIKRVYLIIIFAGTVQIAAAQSRYFSKAAKILFYSKAPIEDIEAHNTKGVSVIDLASGQVEFSVLMKGFEFDKAKMQEHFNENYLESDKYPKAIFTGTIKNAGDLKLKEDGIYNADISGTLTLHGIARQQAARVVITVKSGNVSAVSDFTLALSDFDIKIPALVKDNIGKTVKIIVSVPNYQPLGS
ncbi:MAG: YceI family protein [Chitinophagaceae bacterium]